MSNVCDKCQTAVPTDNDATRLASLLYNDISYAFAIPRHLLPVVVDGNVICEGSPSRAQYLPGQARDTRGYDYREQNEQIVRDAYARMMEEAKAS